ncbi:AraC family transcriptional regulator [Paenibacillaceae bacterium]|nr:AraC family transcriptional regulator [Paenibacillaceae bacterium]
MFRLHKTGDAFVAKFCCVVVQRCLGSTKLLGGAIMSIPFIRAGFSTHESGWDMGEHVHDLLEVSVVLDGKGVFECLGRARTIGPGHVIIVPSGLPHNYRAEQAIRFSVLEAGNLPPATMELFHQLAPYSTAKLQFLSPMTAEQYEALFGKFLRILSQPLRQEARQLTAWMEVLLLFLLQHENEEAHASVAVCADYIRTNLQSKLSIADLAKQCGQSETAFRSIFKQTFGVSPKQFQQACRLEESRWLLRSTARSVKQIAEMVGFESIHAFSAWFQSSECLSPTDWRKLQHGKR